MRILIQVSADLMPRDTTINKDGDVARINRVTTHLNHASSTREDVSIIGWRVRPDGTVSPLEMTSEFLDDMPDGALTPAERRIVARTREIAARALDAALKEQNRG